MNVFYCLDEIDVTKFTSYRLKEIEILKSDAILSKDNKHKCLFQMLPRHMRRRTMGYIRKRLPRSIRNQSIIKPVSVILLSISSLHYISCLHKILAK